MAHDDKTYSPVMTSYDGVRLSFVSRSDAGGEVCLLLESLEEMTTVVLDRDAARTFRGLLRDACLDGFGDCESF